MATTTHNWAIPIPQNGDANAPLVYNRALKLLEALTNLRVLTRQSAPPGSFSDGDVHLVLSPGSGNWSGQDDKFAVALDGTWEFFDPFDGLSYINANDERVFLFNDGQPRIVENVVASGTYVADNATSISATPTQAQLLSLQSTYNAIVDSLTAAQV